MSVLYGPKGQPISSSDFKKSKPPSQTGSPIGRWGGEDIQYFKLPGGATLQFNLDLLTLADYRQMRDHYQVNANLMVLTFMMHQLDWHIVGDDKKQAQIIEDILRPVWTRLIRGISQAFWAGYSPCVLEWENDVDNRKVILNKVKDLLPEECIVNWKWVDGWAPSGRTKPKVPIFDGIKQFGAAWPIPVDNSFWYPLMMENGNHYGKKLLRPAFGSWFFSQLMHLFANRYYERFGEPVPVGRADFEDTVTMDGKEYNGRDAMANILRSLRNRSVVVLPSERQQVGNSGASEFIYDIEYLESQMRGADFERYMTRLDEEISLSLFTPILILRTADVGSYNLGTGHMQLFMWMLNALAGDAKEYIDRYIVAPLKNLNFRMGGGKFEWVYKPWGKQNLETMRAVVTELLRQGRASADLDQLGDIIGLNLSEIKQITQPPPDPNAPPTDPNAPKTDPRTGSGRPERPARPKGVDKAASSVNERVRGQVEKAFRSGSFNENFKPGFGFKRRFTDELLASGYDDAESRVARLYDSLDSGVVDLVRYSGSTSADEFMDKFEKFLDSQLENVCPS